MSDTVCSNKTKMSMILDDRKKYDYTMVLYMETCTAATQTPDTRYGMLIKSEKREKSTESTACM